MFYSQVILAKKGPLAKVWLAAHWGDKKLGRPQIFATDIPQTIDNIVNPAVPLALRVSGHLLLGVVRIYSRKVKYVLNDCTEAMMKLQMAFLPRKDLLELNAEELPKNTTVANFGEYDQVHVVEGFCLPLPDQNEWILAEDDDDDHDDEDVRQPQSQTVVSPNSPNVPNSPNFQPSLQEETWEPFDPDANEEEDDDDDGDHSKISEVEIVRAANDESFLSADQVSLTLPCYLVSTLTLCWNYSLYFTFFMYDCMTLYFIVDPSGIVAPARKASPATRGGGTGRFWWHCL